ncbi:hypothetical protein J2T09_005269 [Neorhizobium huautlense]|uniref:Uncharacterized protein n=1 Tax=Neorhizobium huautlense TaxID=67774 RepID=A0ABT9Q178_9HYPH|nr:hypothetical protein [Neorhizobium huautlense]
MVYPRATSEKAEQTHRISAEIMVAEKEARLKKTDRLRQARLATLARVLENADKP